MLAQNRTAVIRISCLATLGNNITILKKWHGSGRTGCTSSYGLVTTWLPISYVVYIEI